MTFDLHTHSIASDGTAAPAEVVRRAKSAGLELVALTDHDTIAGVEAALGEGARLGMHVLPGVELDTEHTCELHILGLGVDIHSAELLQALQLQRARRLARNDIILEKLRAAGADLSGHIRRHEGVETRLHIARALCEAGYATSMQDAFARYLSPGAPGYHPAQRHTPEEAIACIHSAGGIAVVAHPCHLKGNPHALIARLAAQGLDGLEAYYPTSTQGQTDLFCSLAAQWGLLVSAGSDFHGENRPQAVLGCAWRDVPALAETAEILQARYPQWVPGRA